MNHIARIKSNILHVSILCLAFSLTMCNGPASKKSANNEELSGTISISGAFALYPITVKWADEFCKLHPAVRIDISGGGAGKGMADALAGMVDLGMFSRNVTEAEINQGAWYIAVTNDGVVPTINAANPKIELILQKGLKAGDLKNLFLGEDPHYWEEFTAGPPEHRINVYTRSDACGAAEMWGKFLGANQEALKGTGIFGDPGMADAIKHDVLGIGYNNMVYAYDMVSRKKFPGIEIVPIDLNGDGSISEEESVFDSLDELMLAIQDGRYPSPPARDLYFVSNGIPDNALVVTFLEWILTDGQQFVSEAGYVRLSEDKILKELSKIRP